VAFEEGSWGRKYAALPVGGDRTGRTFISYSRKDGADFARELRESLRNEGLSVWQDVVALEGGSDWWSHSREGF
jgi:hypothetical protein